MKQIVIRVLWPQAIQALPEWLCEWSTAPHLAGDWVTEAGVLPLAELVQRAASQQADEEADVTLLLPAELCLHDCVQLPARSQRQAMQALPFVVEEQLADDIEHVHLAIGAKRTDGRWPVLVVDLAIMAALLDLCEEKNLRLRSVFTDAQLLPAAQGQLSILMHGDRVLLHGDSIVAALDFDIASGMVGLLVGERVFTQVDIRHDAGDDRHDLLAQQLSSEFSAAGETKVSITTSEQSLAPALVSARISTAINLLQGRFVVRQPSGTVAWWQIAAAVVVFAWLGQFGLQVSSGWFFNRGATKLELIAEDQYRKLFPEAKQVSNPRKRLESRLAAGSEGGAETSFAVMFGNSVQALNTLPDREGISIEQLRYESKRGSLEMELKAKSIDQLDQFKQALGKKGLSARISSANDSDGGISGRMQIGKGA